MMGGQKPQGEGQEYGGEHINTYHHELLFKINNNLGFFLLTAQRMPSTRRPAPGWCSLRNVSCNTGYSGQERPPQGYPGGQEGMGGGGESLKLSHTLDRRSICSHILTCLPILSQALKLSETLDILCQV